MPSIIFDELSKGLNTGAEIILKKLNIDEDISISVNKSERLHISCDGKEGVIEYVTDASFFRMLTLFFKEYKKSSSFTYEEKINFDYCGPQLDMSRNAVLKVEKVKEYIEYIAMMGLNRFILYLEDMYELEDYPYFGYMRGRYTKEELKEIDKYAMQFGIEVFPSIQTLGHMERYMHWDESFPARDTMHCLLAEEEKTYELIESMIKTLSECFSSRKIHVGMDEAHDFGLGRYIKINGYKDRFDIMLGHLKRVNEIANKYGMSISMWSDMFFRLTAKDGGYDLGNTEVYNKVKQFIPDNVTLVYWRYGGTEESHDEMIKGHLQMSENVSYAGSTQGFFGFTCDNIASYRAVQAALNSCKKNNIRDIYATVWGDDGCECDFFMTLCAVQPYAENMYNDSDINQKAKENFEFITGANFDAFMDMSQFHNILDGRKFEFYWLKYIGKRLLYQDILLGLCDIYLINQPMSSHYREYAEKMSKYIVGENRWNKYYIYVQTLFRVLALKCEIAENLRTAYLNKDFDYLKDVSENKLDVLYMNISDLRKKVLELWYENNKPFGGEVLDIRFSGLLGRIETAKLRINQFLNGEIEKIEELEAERLPFSTYYANSYSYVVSAGIV